VLDELASCYGAQHDYAEAESLLKKSLAIRERTRGPDHPDVEVTLRRLAALYKGQGRSADAEPLYKRAAAIRQKLQRAHLGGTLAPQF
jgi:tetratricopeptide (TPR) repeat protein